MIVFPNAKINLGLRVTNQRGDGYHNIETLIVPVGLADALEITPAADGRFCFTASGIPIDGDPESNLSVKAFRLMQKRFDIPSVRIFLHKMIPMGAGLGGGSSDAAFTLKLINRLFSLKICNQELKEMASVLGSDCPFFIENRPGFATGRGEVLQPVHADFGNLYIVIAKPSFSVNTAWAYRNIKPSGTGLFEAGILPHNPAEWNGLLVNDFEAVVARDWPEIEEIKQKMTQLGAEYAAMSGSGSAVYGLFNEIPDISGIFDGMFVWQGKLL